jgi:L-alanine-DL-glutamate epimerase-like enolase superfamily enzyme
VPAYDGSIYFADILHPDQGVARIEWEIEQSMGRGHRAFKLKIGRGHKWMPPEEGFRRDVEVIKTVRRVAGPGCKIGIDANNGYDLAGTKRLFGEVGDQDILFAEEMFPEQVEQDLELKQFLRDDDLKTLVADGESARDHEHFIPYLRAKALDVVQADMGRLGPTEWLRLARLAEEHGVLCAPHNWGWQFGYVVILQFGAAIPNFLAAETDPIVFDVYDTSALQFAEGVYTLPDLPGYGVGVNEDVYKQAYAAEETVWE